MNRTELENIYGIIMVQSRIIRGTTGMRCCVIQIVANGMALLWKLTGVK